MSLVASALVVAFVLILLLAFGMAALMRQVSLLTSLVPGARAARAQNPLVGLPSPVAIPLTGEYGVVLAVTGTCAACHMLLKDLASPDHSDLLKGVEVLVLSPVDCADWGQLAGGAVRCIPSAGATLAALNVSATPYALVIDARGIVLKAGPVGSTAGFVEYVQHLRALDASMTSSGAADAVAMTR